jgi:hypothetical protein
VGLYQKIQFYKTLLVGFWCLNILLIALTLAAGLRFFSNGKNFEDSLKNQKQILEILSLESQLSGVASLPTATADQVYEYRRRVDGLKAALAPRGDLPESLRRFADSEKWKMTTPEWKELRASLLGWAKNKMETSEAAFQDAHRTAKEVLLLGIITLLFGIVLPVIVFALLTKNLVKAKKGFEDKLSVWLARVLQKIPDDKENPWTNPALWVEVVLAGFEIFAPRSRHPMVLILRDFLPTVRKEISKGKKETAHGHP